MSENPKKAVIQETGKCIGWVCMTCSRLHTTAIYLDTAEAAEAAALGSATRCCVRQPCACGAETTSTYSNQCAKCWRAEQDAALLAAVVIALLVVCAAAVGGR